MPAHEETLNDAGLGESYKDRQAAEEKERAAKTPATTEPHVAGFTQYQLKAARASGHYAGGLEEVV